jgi:ABC transport system ATP-binding/permease protein
VAERDVLLLDEPTNHPDLEAIDWLGGRTSRSSAAGERNARKELARLERQLDRLSARETELADQLAASAADYERLISLGAELRAVQAEKSDLEDRWLAVAARLDT